jgi:hypothetical protein
MFVSKRIQALEKQLAGLQSQVSTLTTERDSARNDLATAQERITTLENADPIVPEGMIAAEVHNAVVAQRDQLSTRVTELEATAQTAGQRAADIVSSVSVAPIAPEVPGEQPAAQTAAELRQKFDAETDPKKKAAIWKDLSAAMNR